MRFEWDEEKNRRNRAKHGVGFETAALVFEYPFALTRRDPFSTEESDGLLLALSIPLPSFSWCTHRGK
jgi:uncharacterized DUF497 family protein